MSLPTIVDFKTNTKNRIYALILTLISKMLRVSTVFLILSMSSISAFAGLKDSIIYYVTNKSPELIGGLSARNTFIGSNFTSVSGAAIGVTYGGKVKVLAGVYHLTKPVVQQKTFNAFTPQEYKVIESSKFWYLGLTGGYVFYKKDRWTLDIPVRVGFGQATFENYDLKDDKKLLNKSRSFIMPIESGIGVQYNLSWWIGLGAGLGSRIVLGKKTSQKFSGTYYNLGINIFFSDIYYHIRDDMKNNPIHRK